MIKSRIDNILKEYFYNYKSENLNLGLLSGNVSLNNLYFNTEKINSILKSKNIPLRMEVGLLLDLTLDISYLSLTLNLLSIQDLILVFEPCPENLAGDREDYTKKELFEIIEHLVINLKRNNDGVPMEPFKPRAKRNEEGGTVTLEGDIKDEEVQKLKDEEKQK